MVGTPTTMRVLLNRRHWQHYETFLIQFQRTAKALAEQEGNDRLARLTVSQRQFERWYGGVLKTQPHPDQCRVLEALFELRIAELLAPHDLAEIAEKRTLPAVAEPLDLERQVTMAARRALRFTVTVEGTGIGIEALASLRDELTRLAIGYPSLAPSIIVGDLIALQNVVFALLEDRRIRPALARDVYLVAGLCTGMLAKASHDLGDSESAMTQARAAYVCAENAGHRGLLGWAKGLQGSICYWTARPDEAVNYAREAALLANTGTDSRAAWLASLEARALVQLGRGGEAEKSLDRARSHFDRCEADDLDELGGIFRFTRSQQLYNIAHVAVRLPKMRADAEQLAESAVSAYQLAPANEWAFGGQAGAQTDLALARLRNGRLEGAVEAMKPVLDLPSELRIRAVVEGVRALSTGLRLPIYRRQPEAESMCQSIEQFAAAPA